jgi:hypothetical protein
MAFALYPGPGAYYDDCVRIIWQWNGRSCRCVGLRNHLPIGCFDADDEAV